LNSWKCITEYFGVQFEKAGLLWPRKRLRTKGLGGNYFEKGVTIPARDQKGATLCQRVITHDIIV